MSKAHLTDKAIRDIERGFELNRRAIEILDIVVAEWESDPESVKCFDLRIVREAVDVVRELKKLPEFAR